MMIALEETPKITAIDGAIFMPGHECLYDAAGHRIRESCLLRGPTLNEVARRTVERIEVPGFLEIQQAGMIFGGWLPTHWGHFLTEGIARLWFVRHHEDLAGLPLLFTSAINDIAQIRDFFNAARIPAAAITHFTKPTLIERIHMPSATFRNRGTAHPVHLDLPHAVARRLRTEAHPRWSAFTQPVYLSRTRLQGEREFRGEDVLEQHLASHGFRIVYPEQLSFADQVRLVNEHSIFAGCWGSAFHTLAFRVEPTAVETHVICETVVNRNFLMLDDLIGIQAHYVRAAELAPNQVKAPTSARVLNIEAVLAHFSQRGLL
jgi:capsular polysaccharide biosynthesis protein